MKKELWLYVASASSGILVWLAVSGVSGQSEAWDFSWYFAAGYPLVCAVSMATRIHGANALMAWGLIPFAAQFLWMLLTEGPGNLMPLGIVMFGVLSLPAFVAARVGAYFGNRRRKAANCDALESALHPIEPSHGILAARHIGKMTTAIARALCSQRRANCAPLRAHGPCAAARALAVRRERQYLGYLHEAIADRIARS